MKAGHLRIFAVVFWGIVFAGAKLHADSPEGYPEFSWETVPVFHHAAKWDGLYDAEELEFSLAAFLVAAREYAYFGYSWGWDHSQGWMLWFPELDRPLGPPKGDARRKGWVYTREFAHARVRVDLEDETADIQWKK